MSSRELALSLAQKRKDEENKRARESKTSQFYEEERKHNFLSIIKKTLNEYKKDFDIHKVLNSKYEWSITRKDSRVGLLTIKLYWDEGTFAGSDDCRNIPYAEWAVGIYKSVGGEEGQVEYISTPSAFGNKLAKQIQEYY